jgi:hypothetical protein
MRLVLLLAAVLALIVALWFALSSPAPKPTPDPVSIEPERRIESGSQPPIELAESQRSAATPESAPAPAAQAPTSMLASVMVVVTLPSGTVYQGSVVVDFRDPLGHAVELAEGLGGVFQANDVAPGEHTISIAGPDCIPRIERIQVKRGIPEQRFEFALTLGVPLRIRWQTMDGKPFDEVLTSAAEFDRGVTVRITFDDELRSVGESAPQSQRCNLYSGTAGRGQGFGRGESSWVDAPADAVCEVAVLHDLPVNVCASIAGVVVASTAVRLGTSEIVLRTNFDAWMSRRETVRFCLVDAATGVPLTNASWYGSTRTGGHRPRGEVGPEGCGLDSRFLAGSWLLAFEAPGHAPCYREVELEPGANVDLGVLRLDAPGVVAVRATLPDGNPAGAVRIALLPVDRFRWGSRSVISTDAEGRARFDDLSAGPHLLVVADSRFTATPRTVEPHSADRQDVVSLQLVAGVEIALDFGARAALFDFAYIYDSAGSPVDMTPIPPSGLVPLRILPGEYVVELEGAANAAAITVTDESVVYDLRN